MGHNIEFLGEVLSRHFGVESTEIASDDGRWAELESKLKERVLFWLRTDMDKLLQALYRIDVRDQAVAQAFELGEVHQVANELVRLILQRQHQKIQYARRFEDK